MAVAFARVDISSNTWYLTAGWWAANESSRHEWRRFCCKYGPPGLFRSGPNRLGIHWSSRGRRNRIIVEQTGYLPSLARSLDRSISLELSCLRSPKESIYLPIPRRKRSAVVLRACLSVPLPFRGIRSSLSQSRPRSLLSHPTMPCSL